MASGQEGPLGDALRAEARDRAAGLLEQALRPVSTGGVDHVLFAVRSAVAGGATFLHVLCRTDELVLEWDARLPDGDQVQKLVAGPAPDGSPRPLQLLSLALDGAAASDDLVTLDLWEPARGVRLLVDGVSRSLQPLPRPSSSDPRARLRLALRERRGLSRLSKVAVRAAGSRLLPEADLIAERCAYADLDLRVGGLPLDRQVNLGRCLVWRHLRAADGPGLAGEPPARALVTRKEGPVSAILGLCPDPGPLRGLTVVVDGVSHRVLEEIPGLAHACAVAAMPGLAGGASPPDQALLTDGLVLEFLDMAAELLQASLEGRVEPAPPVIRILEELLEADLASGREERAEQAMRHGADLRERLAGTDHPSLVEPWLRLGDFLHARGRAGEAAPFYRRALPFLERNARGLLERDRREEGLAAMQRALELHGRVLDPGDAELGRRHHEFARACRELRDPRAGEHFRQAVAIREAHGGRDLAESLYGLAELLRLERRFAEAEAPARRALELMEAAGTAGRDLVPFLELVGGLVEDRGDYGASLEFMSRAMKLKYL